METFLLRALPWSLVGVALLACYLFWWRPQWRAQKVARFEECKTWLLAYFGLDRPLDYNPLSPAEEGRRVGVFLNDCPVDGVGFLKGIARHYAHFNTLPTIVPSHVREYNSRSQLVQLVLEWLEKSGKL